MGLLGEIRSENVRTRAIDRFLNQFAEPDRSDIATALADKTISLRAIVAVLRKRDIAVTIDQLRNYRRSLHNVA